MRLEGKVAVVTGSSRGIGKATALALAKEGADVVVNGRNRQRLEGVEKELLHIGGKALAIEADVTDRHQAERMVDRIIETFGRIDILVNNVGGSYPAPKRFLEEISEEEWRQTIDLNLTSQFLCDKTVVPHMKKQGGGRIVNIASVAGVWGMPMLWSPAYCAAKAGVISFSRTLAIELGPYGINVNCVSPVGTETERMEELVSEGGTWPETEEEVRERYSTYPLGRPARVEEVANVIAFLASDGASYVSGENILVAGANIGHWPVNQQMKRYRAHVKPPKVSKVGREVAIVTGSGRGIGKEVALIMAQKGREVVTVDIHEGRLRGIEAEIKGVGGNVLAIKADLTDSSQVKRMVDKTIETFGRIDILVNNVGGTYHAQKQFLENISEEEWHKVVNFNLTSQFLCCKAVAPHMKRHGRGKIVNIGTDAAVRGSFSSWCPPYVAAKGAVLGLTRQLAIELGPWGVNVNAVCQMDTMTERSYEHFAGGWWPETYEECMERHILYPIGRPAEPKEVANVVAFLVSEDASLLMGETVIAAGGSVIQ